ncbi:hypothetical protein BJ741DRAFT_250216 [Chytriomyces cf. hyalinus JEL632]|nr:hypothetical protein BJ741DRAFT_250216 [Chytriomyces cf. hyalinus JEL632]
MNGTLNIAQVQAAFEQQQAAFVHLEATFMQQQQVAAKKFQEAAERLDADRKQHEAAATQMEELLAQHRMAASKTQLELAMLTEEETVQEVADIAEAMESFPSLPHVQRRRRSYEIEREHCQKRLEHSKIQEEGVYEEAENQERDNGAELEGGKELTAEEQARQELQEKHPLMRAEREEDIERMYEMLDHNMEVATRQALSENGPWFGGRLKMKVDWVVGQVHRTFDRVMQEGMMDSGAVSDVKRMVARVMDEDGVSEGAVAAVGGDVFSMMFLLGLEVGMYGWGSYVVEERMASAVAMRMWGWGSRVSIPWKTMSSMKLMPL